jgi:predicted PurR-regulated permease PerM
MARMVSFLVLVGILVVVAIVFVRVMAGFFVPLFLAALLGVIVQPLHRWILLKCRGYRYVAAGFTTTIVLLIVLLPIGFVVTTATLEGMSLLDQLQLSDVRTRLSSLRSDFGVQIPREGDVRKIEAALKLWRHQQRQGESPDFRPEAVQNLLDRLDDIAAWIEDQGDDAPLANPAEFRERLARLRDSAPDSVERDEALIEADAQFREFKRNLMGGTYRAWLTEVANPTDEQVEQIRRNVLSAAGPVLTIGGDTVILAGKLIFGIIIMVAALFFLLAEGNNMLEAMIRISPLEEQHVRELVTEFDRACRAIVSATLFSALAQGILAGVGFYFAGLRSSVALLSLLTMVLALVPFTGAAAVWIPVCLYLYFYQGTAFAAVGLAIYGVCVISSSDNFIKPIVLHGQSNLHPLLALLSVLGGIQALGPIGILVGPMVVVFLQTTLKILQRELSSMDRTSWNFWRGFGTTPMPGAAEAAASSAEHPLTEDRPPGSVAPAPNSALPEQLPTPLPRPASGNGQKSGGSPSGGRTRPAGKKRKK